MYQTSTPSPNPARDLARQTAHSSASRRNASRTHTIRTYTYAWGEQCTHGTADMRLCCECQHRICKHHFFTQRAVQQRAVQQHVMHQAHRPCSKRRRELHLHLEWDACEPASRLGDGQLALTYTYTYTCHSEVSKGPVSSPTSTVDTHLPLAKKKKKNLTTDKSSLDLDNTTPPSYSYIQHCPIPIPSLL